MTQHYLNVIPVLLLILLVIVGLGFAVRRFSPNLVRGNVLLRVLANQSLGGKERLVLVQAGEDYLLLGVSPGQVRTLHKVAPEGLFIEAEAATPPPAVSFASVLQSLTRKG